MRRKPEKRASEVINSAWKNCYWFARMLLNTDQYSAPGKNEKFMLSLVNELEPLIVLNTLTENDKYKICRDTLMNNLQKFSEGESKNRHCRWRIKISVAEKNFLRGY